MSICTEIIGDKGHQFFLSEATTKNTLIMSGLLLEKQQPKRRSFVPLLCGIATTVIVVTTYWFTTNSPSFKPLADDSLCPLVEKLNPEPYVYDFDKINQILTDKHYREEVVSRWSGAIQIPSISTDEMLNPNITDDLDELYKLEPLWKSFTKLHEFLAEKYPLIHSKLKVEKVNKFALLYTWQGTNKDKKPILLTAHQDVVPIDEETLNQWKYPAFSGTVEGDKIYGRGASDCKDLMMSLFEVIELLLLEGKFQPERTILLGFGYDEESQGTGAIELGKFLEKRYGEESLYAIIDEGSEGYTEMFGTNFVLIATSEKGHLNSVIDLYTPGGHSSVPPKYTSIGIMAKLIDEIEETPFSPVLSNANPFLNTLQCGAEHGNMNKSLKSDILKAQFDVNANSNVINYVIKSGNGDLISTTQAIDIINGGVKSNALPEHVSLLVNHRIAAEESVELTSDKILENIKTIAKRFDLGVVFNNQTLIEPTAKGFFNYKLDEPLQPSPASPIGTQQWIDFSGSLRYFYEDICKDNGTFVVAPMFMGGNTDTKAYWNLARNIYRYAPYVKGGELDTGIHSINEYALIEGHMRIISFYYFYLQVVDQLEG